MQVKIWKASKQPYLFKTAPQCINTNWKNTLIWRCDEPQIFNDQGYITVKRYISTVTRFRIYCFNLNEHIIDIYIFPAKREHLPSPHSCCESQFDQWQDINILTADLLSCLKKPPFIRWQQSLNFTVKYFWQN